MSAKGLDKQIAIILRDRRIELNLTQFEIAQKLKKHRTYVSKVECGDRFLTMSGLEKYCKVLSIKLSDLI